MSERRTMVWLAGSAPRPGEVRVEAIDDHAAAGLTAGDDAAALSKRAPNEDSLALLRLRDRAIAIVADAHFGPSSSERVVGDFVSEFTEGNHGDPSDPLVLLDMLRRRAPRWRSDPSPDRESETTLLCAVIDPDRVTWISVGDSYLFRLRRDRPVRRLNRVAFSYVGREDPDLLDVDFGTAELAPGDLVMLATDGIDADASGLELAHAAAIVLEQPTPLDSVKALLARASFAAKGGGGDNLAVVVVRV